VDADPRPGRRRARGEEEEDERGEERRAPETPQAGTFSGARTRRENVIAPSSSDP
jgi:hypothetical protein